MAFQEVSSLDADVTIALGKVNKQTGKPYPKQAEGYYLGSRSVASKRGESKLHFLQTANGNLGIWGTTDMDRKLGQASVGSMVRITSTGTKPTPNGDMYLYKVEIDRDNAIEVSPPAASVEASNSGTLETSSESEDTGFDEDALQAEALTAAERKARYEALLKGGTKRATK